MVFCVTARDYSLITHAPAMHVTLRLNGNRQQEEPAVLVLQWVCSDQYERNGIRRDVVVLSYTLVVVLSLIHSWIQPFIHGRSLRPAASPILGKTHRLFR